MASIRRRRSAWQAQVDTKATRRCLEPSTSEQTANYGRDRRKPNSTVAACPWTVACSEFLAGKCVQNDPTPHFKTTE